MPAALVRLPAALVRLPAALGRLPVCGCDLRESKPEAPRALGGGSDRE